MTYRSTSSALVPVTESDDPDVIRRQIDYTREQLSTTINAIADRLSPDTLIEQAKSSAKEATVGKLKDMRYEANRKVEGMSNSLSQTIRDNPLPVAVIGLGLGWLLLSDRSKRDAYQADGEGYRTAGYRYYEDNANDPRMGGARERVREATHAVEERAGDIKHRVGEVAQSAGEAVYDVKQRAGEAISDTTQRVGDTLSGTAARVGETVSETAARVGETAEMVQERAGEAASRTRSEADRLRMEAEWRGRMTMARTKQSFWNSLEENPLAFGAVVAIAGAAVGAAVPATEYENKLMGETRDRLMDEAKTRAQDAVERVQSVVEDTQRAVVSEVKDSAKRHDLIGDDADQAGTQSGSGIIGDAGRSVSNANSGSTGSGATSRSGGNTGGNNY